METYGNPVVVGDDGAQALARVPLGVTGSDGGGCEDWLQNLIYENPMCLPIDQIDAGYLPLVPLCREMQTGAGPIDVVFATPTGRLVVLEAKLWRNPEARRKVVGQILDYAKELRGWSYDDLQRAVNQRCPHISGENAPYELVAKAHPDTDEASFVDGIERSLRTGQFLLLVVGDGIREGVAGIAEYLQEATSLDFSFGLVELSIYEAGDGKRLILPRVLTRTVTVQRSVVRLMDGALTMEEEEPSEETGPENDAKQYCLSFWSDYLSKLELDDKEQRRPNPRPIGYVTLPMPPSGSQAWLCCYSYQAGQSAGIFINFAKGSFGQMAYQSLLGQKEQILEELGVNELQWEPDAERGGSICARRQFADVRDPDAREEILTFLADMTNRFVNAFRPRLMKLAEDL